MIVRMISVLIFILYAMRWSYDVLICVHDVIMMFAWVFFLVCAICVCLEGKAWHIFMIYIYIYRMILKIFPCNRCMAIFVGFVCFCVGCHRPTTGHNLRDLPSILTPGRSCRHILRTKWAFASKIIWVVTTTQQQLWLSFNLVLSLSSISLLLSNQLSHASVLIVVVLPRPFPQRWHCPVHRNWQLWA